MSSVGSGGASIEARSAEATHPHNITLERYASVCAAIAEGDRPLGEVLAAAALGAAAWRDVSEHYTRILAADAMNGDGALAEAYAVAFARAQDAIRPAPELSPEEWAELTVAVSGPGGAAVLAARGLSPADHLRLSRAWARRLAAERTTAKRYHEAFFRFSGARRG
jgi:hypothetical protein